MIEEFSKTLTPTETNVCNQFIQISRKQLAPFGELKENLKITLVFNNESYNTYIDKYGRIKARALFEEHEWLTQRPTIHYRIDYKNRRITILFFTINEDSHENRHSDNTIITKGRNRFNIDNPIKDIGSFPVEEEGGEIHYVAKELRGCTMTIIPKDGFRKKIDYEKLNQPCFYILVEQTRNKCYVGYTNDATERIATHKTKRRLWKHALVFTYYNKDCVYLTDPFHFDIADVAYLEYLAFDSIPMSRLSNSKKADKPDIKDYAKKYISNVFNDIRILSSEIGLHIFK